MEKKSDMAFYVKDNYVDSSQYYTLGQQGGGNMICKNVGPISAYIVAGNPSAPPSVSPGNGFALHPGGQIRLPDPGSGVVPMAATGFGSTRIYVIGGI